MDKEVVVHTCNGTMLLLLLLLLSHFSHVRLCGTILSNKKGCIRVSSNGVDEPRAYTERSQKEKIKHCILTHIYMESRKMVLRNLFAGLQWRQTQRTDLWMKVGVGRGERVRGVEREACKHRHHHM